MDKATQTIRKVNATLTRHHMVSKGDRVVVAVSGGPDSVCLLHILFELKGDLEIDLIVAHFDHGLRPGEDEAETDFVVSLAQSLGLPFEVQKVHPPLKAQGPSVEEKARAARYHFLDRTRDRHHAQKIAVGHNLNDQAETVLMRLLRGSGPSGLTGIPPCRDDTIIRPLIQTSRHEVEAYMAARGYPAMTDSSNLETGHLRNKIRLELMPRLQQYQPRIAEILARTADIFRQDEAWLGQEAQAWVEKTAATGDHGGVQVPLPPFLRLADALKARAVRALFKRTAGDLRHFNRRHIEAVLKMATGSKPQSRVVLPKALTVKRVYDRLVFKTAGNENPKAFSYTLQGPGRFRLQTPGYTLSLEELDRSALPNLEAPPHTAFLDAGRITYPLEIRSFRAGDRFVPLGVGGHKKVKDFFQDLKVPSEVRRTVPILTCRGTLLWVGGFRIDERFKITPDTQKVLKASLFKNQGGDLKKGKGCGERSQG